jgi:predicted phage terminase large subunit-like protein
VIAAAPASAGDARREALREAAGEELARRRLLSFAERVYPRFAAPPHIRYIAELLEKVESGAIRQLCVSVPVRHGKSVICSQVFPAWYIGRHPTDPIIVASHSEGLAVLNSRVAKHLVEDDRWPFPDVRMSRDSASVQRWNVTAGGGVYAVGVGGSITGRGGAVLLVDDPLHDAHSESERDNAWRWFTETAVPRLEPGGAIIVVAARFASDDVVGRIQSSEDAPQWTFVSLPAIALENDPLGRQPGEPIWPERMPLAEIERRRSTMDSSFAFEAQFQQNPITREGALFKYDWLVYDKTFPEDFERVVLAIDPASKASKTADHSAAVVIGAKKGQFYVLDVVRAKVELPELRRLVINLCEKWTPSRCLIEDTANGIGAIQDLMRNTALPIVPFKPKGSSKIARAEGIVGLFESRRVHLPVAAPWLTAFLTELLAFPNTINNSKSPDQVDALVMALNSCQRQPVEWNFAFAHQ